MAENSKIEWTDHTFSPWRGCTKVSPACDHCYAEAFDKRFGGDRWGPKAARTRTSAANWRKPLQWDRKAAVEGVRRKVFCASLADVFDNHGSILPDWRIDLWNLIEATPNLDWLLLTKRPQNIARYLPSAWGDGWPNVWLGTTVENQVEAERRIPHLLAVPARVRFLSCEPLLGPVDLTRLDMLNIFRVLRTVDDDLYPRNFYDALRGRSDIHPIHNAEPDWGPLSWVIAGGESGPGARPSHPDWFRILRDQCAAAGVPFHFKQWGEYKVIYDRNVDDPDWRRCDKIAARTPKGRWLNLAGGHGFHGECVVRVDRVGKARAGRLLDGVVHDGKPA